MKGKVRRLSRASRYKLLAFLYWLHLLEVLTPPRLIFTRKVNPIQFAILSSGFTFALLPLMPLRPISMPLAFGAGLSGALIVTAIRRATCLQGAQR